MILFAIISELVDISKAHFETCRVKLKNNENGKYQEYPFMDFSPWGNQLMVDWLGLETEFVLEGVNKTGYYQVSVKQIIVINVDFFSSSFDRKLSFSSQNIIVTLSLSFSARHRSGPRRGHEQHDRHRLYHGVYPVVASRNGQAVVDHTF